MKKLRHFWTDVLIKRLEETPKRIQILMGPRQVGKTTALLEVMKSLPEQCHLATADEQQRLGTLWIEQEWEKGRQLLSKRAQAYLFLDEVQKIQNWSEAVKRLWDEDRRVKAKLHVVLSGSSSLSIQSGLTESLAGRYEIIPALHGTWSEFKQLSGKSLEHFIYFGGYPGSLDLISDPVRWRSFVSLSIVEAVLSRDIFLLTRVDKPALLRQLFHLASEYSGQILSYQKSIGQLQDAGNTTTLAHYLELLDQAFLIRGLQKFDPYGIRKRSSSPKFQVHNTALTSALDFSSFEEAKQNSDTWGRRVESAVGAYLVNQSRRHNFELSYWRERNMEVDFVLSLGKQKVLAIEVKSGRQGKTIGLLAFKEKFPYAKTLVLQLRDGSLENFLLKNPLDFL